MSTELELIECAVCQMGDHASCDGELWTSNRACDCTHGYDPTLTAPSTLAEHIVHAQWRDSQLTWIEEAVANLVYLEHDLGPERHAVYDHIMSHGASFSYAPYLGSVRPVSMPAFLGLDRDEYTVPD